MSETIHDLTKRLAQLERKRSKIAALLDLIEIDMRTIRAEIHVITTPTKTEG